MQKAEIIDAIVQVGDLSKRQADDVIASFVEQITNALARGESVNLIGFGAFDTRERAERQGRHPQSGETITIASSISPVFRPGKKLKEAVGD